MSYTRSVVTPAGFTGDGAESPLDALKRARALLAEEGRFCEGYWFYKEPDTGGNSYDWQVKAEDPLCGSWSACADGALSLVTLGAIRFATSPGEIIWQVADSDIARKTLAGDSEVRLAQLIRGSALLRAQAGYLVNAANTLSASAFNAALDGCLIDPDDFSGSTRESVPFWNDDVFKTRENVLAWFDYVIANEEERNK